MITNPSDSSVLQLVSEICGVKAAVSITQKYPTLTELARADVAELRLLENVGGTHARRIKAALELSARLSREVLGESPVLDTPDRIADLLREDTRPYTVETLQVVLLNTRRRLIRVVPIANGTIDTLLVHAREVFRHAIACGAAALVLAHNHPSGSPEPSEADIKVTRDLIRAGQLLKIEVLDHVILGRATPERPKDYSSLRELGYFFSA